MSKSISMSISDEAFVRWELWKKLIGKNQTDAMNDLIMLAPMEQLAKKV